MERMGSLGIRNKGCNILLKNIFFTFHFPNEKDFPLASQQKQAYKTYNTPSITAVCPELLKKSPDFFSQKNPPPIMTLPNRHTNVVTATFVQNQGDKNKKDMRIKMIEILFLFCTINQPLLAYHPAKITPP